METIRWSVRLLANKPWRILPIVGCGVVAFLIGLIGFKSILLGIAGSAIILGSTADYWLGTAFRVDRNRAQAQVGASLTALDWDKVEKVRIGPKTIRLLPRVKIEPLATFRGVTLRTLSSNHNDVISFIKDHVQECAQFEYVDDSQTV